MLTTCPHCQAWFRVRAEHLTAANGVVTCGKCDRVFSALASLVDESTFAAVEPVARRDAAVPTPDPAAPVPGLAAPASELRADEAETAPVPPGADDEPAEVAGDDAAAVIAQEDDAPLPPPAAIPNAEEAAPVAFDDAPDSARAEAADAPVTTGSVEPAMAADGVTASRENGITQPVPAVESAAPPEPAAENFGEARADSSIEHANAGTAAAAATAAPVATPAPDSENLETVISRGLPPLPAAVPVEPAAEDTGESHVDRAEERADALDTATTQDPDVTPEIDSEILETVITRAPPSPVPVAPAALQVEPSADSDDDTFSPGATAFTRAYAAFEDTDTHGEDLEFVFADDDDLDATLHMARPDLRVEPPPKLALAADDASVGSTFELADPAPEIASSPIDLGAFPDDDDLDATLHMGRPDLRVEPPPARALAADDAPVGPTFDLADPDPEPGDAAPPIDLGALADDDELDATLHMGRPDLRVEPAPASAADAPLVASTFDLADPEPADTTLPADVPADTAASQSAPVAMAPATDAGGGMAIDRDAALDFGGLDALPGPAGPVDDMLPVRLPEDDAVIASLLDDPALSPAARAALASTLAAEAAAEGEAIVEEAADAERTASSETPAGADANQATADRDALRAAGAETSPVGALAVMVARVSADEGEHASAPPAGAVADLPVTAGDAPHRDDEPPGADASATPDADVPPALVDDLRALETPRRTRRAGWTVFALALLALGLAQGAFVGRERLLTWMPATAPAIDFLCARLPCAERRVEGVVRLLARDVREHPQYRDALLVNATIVNDGAVPTPYPVIDLRLRDAAGNVLAARQFQPDEYLDQSIDQAQGMPAGRPIYVVLELAGDARAAVSFEFTFL